MTAIQYLADKQGTLLKLLLGMVIVLFLGILLSAYLIARKTNPVLLDEHGKPIITTRCIGMETEYGNRAV